MPHRRDAVDVAVRASTRLASARRPCRDGVAPRRSKYFIFALYLPLFQLILDVFILNTQELVFGWKVYDYVSYQRYRFSVRDQRWMMNSKVLDESIAESLQTLDLMCFSEQYYFLVALISFGMLLVTTCVEINQ